MRILFPTSPERPHPFLITLMAGLSGDPTVECVENSLDRFWDGPTDTADVLHVQWPEVFSRWREPSSLQLSRFSERLAEWKKDSAVVVTVHNLKRHFHDAPGFGRLYQTTFDAADGFIHLGNASVARFAASGQFSNVPHAVIPLPIFSPFREPIEARRARRELGLDPDSSAILSFGELRDDRETRLLLKGFAGVRSRRKQLMIVGRITLPKSPWSPSYHWRRLVLRYHPRIFVRLGNIPNRQVHLYVSAADVVVIPRFAVLNSGSVPLGFMFGKVVVGPDSGVVGETLRSTGNPVFAPGDARALAAALQAAQLLAEEGKGEANRLHALEYWDPNRTAQQHVSFYRRVCEARVATLPGSIRPPQNPHCNAPGLRRRRLDST